MEPEHARRLLARERDRIEKAIAELGRDEAGDQDELGERGSEALYQQEFDAGRARDLRDQIAALERAEARLVDGTYGLSVESGDPIPDGRLEALPTAERTVQEEQRAPGR